MNTKQEKTENKIMAKSTHLTIKGENFHVSCNGNNDFLNSQLDYTGSSSGGVDIVGSFQDANLPNCLFQFEFNNPWIGSPWGAIGTAIDDSGWDNDRTNFREGDSKIFNLKFYDGGDDGEYEDFPVKVSRLGDTDTKNFVMELGYYGNE